jgi:hypothetical protein
MDGFVDKVTGFFDGGDDVEEIAGEAGDVAEDVAEDVVDDIVETQSNLGEYKEIITIFVIVLIFTCPLTYTIVGGILTKLTKLIKVPMEFGASALTERSWKLWVLHSIVIVLVIAGLKHKKLI